MLRACYTDGALGVTSREECTGVRSAALLNSVYGQHHGKERRCDIRPTVMDAVMLKKSGPRSGPPLFSTPFKANTTGKKGALRPGRRRWTEEEC